MTRINQTNLSKLKILFLHPNFPGQFVDIAQYLAKQGAEVTFLCHTHHDRKLPKINRIALKNELGPEALKEMKLEGFQKALTLANQYMKGMKELKDNGFSPDIIISHSGFGCGLHSPYIWPKSTKIAYVEWWFNENCILYTLDANNKWWSGPRFKSGMRERNMCVAYELTEAHALITPTKWQHQQLPEIFRKRCAVVSEGVNHKIFKPAIQEKSLIPLITYGTRGMEAMKGFPEFIEELPKALEANRDLIVEIAGEDRICYGGKAPPEGTYGKWAKNFLEKWIIEDRVRFVGRLDHQAYLKWLQKSWVHVHLTRPFVSSWSLLEAMACGCCIIASDSPNSREFLNEDCAILVNHRNYGWLQDKLKILLYDTPLRSELSKKVTIQSLKWNKSTSIEQWVTIIGDQVQSAIHNN